MNQQARRIRLRGPEAAAMVIGLGGGAIAGAQGPILFSAPQHHGDGSHHTIADLNGDGLLDVALVQRVRSNPISEEIRVAINRGDLQFDIHVLHAAEAQFRDLSSGDINGDGDIDLAWTNIDYPDYAVSVFDNAGDGLSGPVEPIPTPRPFSMSLLDHDLDGDLDFAISSWNRIFFYENRGAEGFSLTDTFTHSNYNLDLTRLIAGDFDNDGDADVVAIGVVLNEYTLEVKDSLLLTVLSNGDGSFPEHREIALPWRYDAREPETLAAGDFDGDSDLDIVITASDSPFANSPLSVAVLENLEIGAGFEVRRQYGLSAATSTSHVAVADIELDGDIDFVVKPNHHQVSAVFVYENLGGFDFTPAPFLASPSGGHIALADLTGDGLTDVSVAGGTWYSMTNLTNVAAPTFLQSDLFRGEAARFGVSGLRPNELAYFLYSRSAPAPGLGQSVLGGLTLDLAPPVIVLGSARANAQGRATLSRILPPDAPLGPVSTQAVVRRGPGGANSIKSRFQYGAIRDR